MKIYNKIYKDLYLNETMKLDKNVEHRLKVIESRLRKIVENSKSQIDVDSLGRRTHISPILINKIFHDFQREGIIKQIWTNK